MMEMLASLDFVCHNLNKPTFQRNSSLSYIDVTCSSTDLCNKISNWDVLDTESTSLHKYIYIEINGKELKAQTRS